jgi:hypothetical protein
MINEKNVPTDPAKWKKWVGKAKQKFDVYPSAYANGWAAKMYKDDGGKWKTNEGDTPLPLSVASGLPHTKEIKGKKIGERFMEYLQDNGLKHAAYQNENGDIKIVGLNKDQVKEALSKLVEEWKGKTDKSVNEIKVNYDFKPEELQKIIQTLKRHQGTLIPPIKAMEKALGKEISAYESVNEAYPTNLKVGSVIMGQGFTMLKGIEGGRYYKVVEMDNYSATLVPSDKNGNVKGSKKVRHKLDSIEGGIKTAKRGDENGIVIVKESINEEVGLNFQWIYKKVNKNKKAFFDFLSNERKKFGDDHYSGLLHYTLKDYKENPSKYKTIKDKEEKLWQMASAEKKYPGNESVNEAPAKDNAEKIRNYGTRISKLQKALSAAKTPNQKTLLQSRLKTVLQNLSNLKKSMGIKRVEGFPGGAGVGVSLPGGYINGAPTEKDVKKMKKNLK